MIKIDIEMPKTCNGCFATYEVECREGYVSGVEEGTFCSLMPDMYPKNEVEDHCWNDTKPSWCPLEEVE